MHLLPPAAAFLMSLCINIFQVEKEPNWWDTFILLSRDLLSGLSIGTESQAKLHLIFGYMDWRPDLLILFSLEQFMSAQPPDVLSLHPIEGTPISKLSIYASASFLLSQFGPKPFIHFTPPFF